MKKLVVLIGMLLITTTAIAAVAAVPAPRSPSSSNWLYLGSAEGGCYSVFLDQKSVSHTYPVVVFITKILFNSCPANAQTAGLIALVETHLDCVKKVYTNNREAILDSNGDLLKNQTFNRPPQKIIPGSNLDALGAIVCKRDWIHN